MPFHVYQVRRGGEMPRWFGVRIEFLDDRWAATCRETRSTGEDLGGEAVAPVFYGVTAQQALRRMVEALENSFDEVVPAEQER